MEEKNRLLYTNSICEKLAQRAKKSCYTKCGLCFGAFPKVFFNCELRHLDPTRETDIWQKIKVIDEKLEQLDLSLFDKLLLKIKR
jgi:hypothetical protein